MKIGILKYVNYLLTGYMWGRTISIMHQCIEGTESWDGLHYTHVYLYCLPYLM